MIDAVASFLQIVLSSSNAIAASQAGSATMWALLLATAIIVVLRRRFPIGPADG